MVLINDLTVVIVTYMTNDQILDECIQSILGKAKILVIENSDNKDFKIKYETIIMDATIIDQMNKFFKN